MTSTETQRSYFSMPHILMVDDDARIRDLVSRYLLDRGFVVSSAADAQEAKALMGQCDFDMAIVDVMMPGQSGVDLTADLRSKNNDLPVLLLTALGEIDDRLAGFDAGADDYLPKPFEPAELVMRLKALLRRTMQPVAEGRVLVLGAVEFDVSSARLTNGDGDIIAITDAERDLLLTMAQKPGRVFSRDDLAEASGVASVRAIDVQMTRLRRKIEHDSRKPLYIQTVRGEGYLLRPDQVRQV